MCESQAQHTVNLGAFRGCVPASRSRKGFRSRRDDSCAMAASPNVKRCKAQIDADGADEVGRCCQRADAHGQRHPKRRSAVPVEGDRRRARRLQASCRWPLSSARCPRWRCAGRQAPTPGTYSSLDVCAGVWGNSAETTGRIGTYRDAAARGGPLLKQRDFIGARRPPDGAGVLEGRTTDRPGQGDWDAPGQQRACARSCAPAAD